MIKHHRILPIPLFFAVVLLSMMGLQTISCDAHTKASEQPATQGDPAPDEMQSTPNITTRYPIKCIEMGEEIVEAIIEGKAIDAPLADDVKKKETDWFDQCATPPHGSLFMAIAAFRKKRRQQAAGLLYDTIASLKEWSQGPVPQARSAAVILAKALSFLPSGIAEQAEVACKEGAGAMCAEAVYHFWKIGYPPARFVGLLPYAKGQYSVDLREISARAYFARMDIEHGCQQAIQHAGNVLPQNLQTLQLLCLAKQGEDTQVDEQTAFALCGAGDCLACEAYSIMLTGQNRNDEQFAAAGIACSCGGGESCVLLGTILATRGETEKSAEVYQTGCDFDNAQACTAYGNYLLALKLPDKAKKPLEKGCMLGDGMACITYGSVSKNEDDARGLLLLTCRRGKIAEACMTMAFHLEISQDMEGAKSYADEACAMGNGEGCYLSAKLIRGTDGEAVKKRCELYDRACIFQQAESCRIMVDQCMPDADTNATTPYLHHACDYGDAQSCRRVADLEKQNDKHIVLLQESCGMGDNIACLSLTPATFDKDLATTACNKGSSYGCHRAFMLAVANDELSPSVAEMGRKACAGGFAQSCLKTAEMLDALSDNMGASQILHSCCKQDLHPACCGAYGCRMTALGSAPRAMESLKKACDMDDPTGCGCLGQELASRGKIDAALVPLAIGCKTLKNESCTVLARITEKTDPLGVSLPIAETMCLDHRDTEACFISARIHYANKDYKNALDRADRAAVVYPKAWMLAGQAAIALEQVPVAKERFEKACKADIVTGCLSAADIEPSLDLFDRSCQLGSAEGCYEAAAGYEKQGNVDAAKTYRELACGLDPKYCE